MINYLCGLMVLLSQGHELASSERIGILIIHLALLKDKRPLHAALATDGWNLDVIRDGAHVSALPLIQDWKVR